MKNKSKRISILLYHFTAKIATQSELKPFNWMNLVILDIVYIYIYCRIGLLKAPSVLMQSLLLEWNWVPPNHPLARPHTAALIAELKEIVSGLRLHSLEAKFPAGCWMLP